MAERNEFLAKQEEKNNKDRNEYKERMKKHRMSSVYRLLLFLVVLVVIGIVIVVQYNRHVYRDYEVVKSVERELALGAIDIELGKNVLTYSKDGAHCTKPDGIVTWNQTYEIQDLLIATNGEMVAITGYNERTIYVASAEKILGQISTNMPIKNLAISATGIVSTVVEEGSVTWINTYDSVGNLLYTGQARMNESGYPFSISLSPNGELLAISYLFLEAGNLKSNVAFYNFGQVGDNYNDFLVSANPYSGLIVPEVKFINDTTAIAVGDSRFMVYKGGQIPTSSAERLFDKELEAAYFGKETIGLVFRNETSDERYLLQVYDDKTNLILEQPFDIEYTNIVIEKDKVMIYGETQILIVTLKGFEKFNGSLSKSFRLAMPANSPYKYYLVSEDSIDTIQLR